MILKKTKEYGHILLHLPQIIKMKKALIFLFFIQSIFAKAQNEQLAQNYFDRGDFEKALINYDELLKFQPNNYLFFQRQVECYQQLSQFDKAEKAIQTRLNQYKQPNLLVELGYNFQLQKNEAKANKFYENALESIKQNVTNVYSIANVFEKKVLLKQALLAYQTANALDATMNFNFQMGILYGQLGNTDLMIDKFLTEALQNPQSNIMIQNQLSRFIAEDATETFSQTLKKSLLLRAQKSQDVFWNQYLSWFFVQQKEYAKAFVQEKAIYKREPESFNNIVNLADLAVEEKDYETAKEILSFVLENTNDVDLKIQSNTTLLKLKTESVVDKDLPMINEEFNLLLKQFGLGTNSLMLQILQAHFVTFKMKNSEMGKNILKKALQLPINKYQEADVKMELADILLFEEKFNQAQIYYTQIQEDLSQDAVGNEASLKAAKTSYFKGDFDWALQQFKALKSASSQLIANDALELYLLINDNKVADSTFVALKKFARGDYMLYQNKTADALQQFTAILKENKGNEVEPATLIRLGKVYEKTGDFTTALLHYENIINNFKDCIYVDEALFFAANIYFKNQNLPEKAKPLYEKIIFSHQDSIYFVEARQRFRQIRGDKEI